MVIVELKAMHVSKSIFRADHLKFSEWSIIFADMD